MEQIIDSLKCEICNGPIYSNNTVGICKRNSDCRRENGNKRACLRRGVTYVPQPETKSCEVCGGTLSRTATVGICTSNTVCLNENQRKATSLERGIEFKPKVPCSVCGEPTFSDMGVCTKTPECHSEYDRKKNLEKWQAGNHAELTYLMFSPGLNAHKIGKTTNMTQRLQMLRCGCFDIELITTFPYDTKLERWLHKKFKANRIPGTEWFTDITEVDVKNAVIEYELENH